MPNIPGQTLLFGPTDVPSTPTSTSGSIAGGVKAVHGCHIEIDMSVRDLCRKRYPLHPKGCPNYGKRPTCPPQALPIREVIDFSKPIYIAWNDFDLAEHRERMRKKHPHWSYRQATCVLYWQPTARRALRLRIRAFLKSRAKEYDETGLLVVECPEACGVNVTETMRRVGVELEWPPVNVARQVALIGWPCAVKEPT